MLFGIMRGIIDSLLHNRFFGKRYIGGTEAGPLETIVPVSVGGKKRYNLSDKAWHKRKSRMIMARQSRRINRGT